MIEVGWILFFTSSLALLRSSAAKITTEVVPSPTSLSWIQESSTSTLAAGCWTSNYLRIVAPSFVIVTSPMSSTSILSNPCGPNELLTMFDKDYTAITNKLIKNAIITISRSNILSLLAGSKNSWLRHITYFCLKL